MITITNAYNLLNEADPLSRLLRDSDGNFYVLGHQDKTVFIESVINIASSEMRRIPSPREVAYGYARVSEAIDNNSMSMTICSSEDPHASAVTRWTFF